MRVGIISPNLIANSAEMNRLFADENLPWAFEGVAKKASMLVDKVYLTQDLDITCTIVDSADGADSGYFSQTLRYLRDKGFILSAADLGYSSGEEFVRQNLRGAAATLHNKLLSVGNPGLEEGDETWSIGQPELNEFAAQNSWTPRHDQARKTGVSPSQQQVMYESFLLRRNAVLLSNAGIEQPVVLGSLYGSASGKTNVAKLWRVVINEMPQLDERTPWDEVLAYRADQRTQHLSRSLRGWVRKSISNDWSDEDARDEIRELVYGYEEHMRIARMGANKGPLEFLVTGLADVAEKAVKLRFKELAELVTCFRERRVQLLKEEAEAPGREIALLPDVAARFPQGRKR